MLAKVTNADGYTITFSYDGDGRRISKTASGVTTKYYYDGVMVAKETDVNGVVKAEYLYGIGGTPLTLTRDGQTYYYLYNAHGDTIALVNGTGAVTVSYSYNPWGVVKNIGSLINPFLYAGQFGIFHDLETGFDLMQVRYYDSST